MDHIRRIAVIGECMVELKQVNNALQSSFGGDTLNTAVYLARLTKDYDVSICYATGLGQDPFSRAMLAAWQQEGVASDLVTLSADKLPGLYAIETAENGERHFYYWRNDSAAKFWLDEQDLTCLVEALSQYQLIYLSGISMAILTPQGRERLMTLLSLCHQKGLKIAFDNNYRPALWQDSQDAQAYYQRVLSLTDIAFLTFDDEQWLWGDDDEQQTIQRTKGFGVKEIVIKRGAKPCYLVNEEGDCQQVSAISVENIIDTTAAGDSFSAAYLAKRILGGTTQQAAQAGHTLAGRVIQYSGAIIPRHAMPAI